MSPFLTTSPVPPIGVYIVAGCGADLLINIALTILAFLPGHLHAFYVIYVYYSKKEQISEGLYDNRPAPGVYSSNVNHGGMRTPPPQQQHHYAPAPQQGHYAPPPQQQQYGTIGPKN